MDKDFLPLLDMLRVPRETAMDSGKVREVKTAVTLNLNGKPETITLTRYVATNDPDGERFRTPQGAYRNWHLIERQGSSFI